MKYIDLFAGCGGLSLGLYNAGWQGVFAIEKNADAFGTLKHNLIENKNHFNWPDWLPQKNHDINKVITKYRSELLKLRGKIDLVAGGPPCQGFSVAGRRREDDIRNSLIDSYLQFIEIIMPKIIFFENVKGFTLPFIKSKSLGRKYSDYVKNKLEEMGYSVFGKIVNFSEFGVPQTRQRFILVGFKKSNKNDATDPKDFFDKLFKQKDNFLMQKGIKAGLTIASAISDLKRTYGEIDSPDSKGFKSGVYGDINNNYQALMRNNSKEIPDSHRFAKHTPNIKKRFDVILKENLRSSQIQKRFGLKKMHTKKLNKYLPSPTLTTLPDDYIHYCEPRIMTVREYARIQTFPDWFEFIGKYTTGGKRRVIEVPRYTQIGNAIPSLFSEQVGIVLRQISDNYIYNNGRQNTIQN